MFVIMESNLYQQQSKSKGNKTGLLPNYFKKIGLAVMLLAFLPALLVKTMDIDMPQAQKETFKYLTMNIIILGLWFVAWAKDKIEDEMTLALRLKSLSFAFIWAVLYVVGKPLTDWLFKNQIADYKAQELVLSMLLVYLFMYLLQKKGR